MHAKLANLLFTIFTLWRMIRILFNKMTNNRWINNKFERISPNLIRFKLCLMNENESKRSNEWKAFCF